MEKQKKSSNLSKFNTGFGSDRGGCRVYLCLLVNEDLDTVLCDLLVKMFLLLRVVQRVAEAVAAALSHPDAQPNAGGVLLKQCSHPLYGAGCEGEGGPGRNQAPSFHCPDQT